MGLIAISSLMLLGGMYLMIAFAWWLLQIIANWRIVTNRMAACIFLADIGSWNRIFLLTGNS